MFYGKPSEETKKLEKQYEQVIGVDIEGEMGFEIDKKDEDLYIMLLKECIKTKTDIFDVIDKLNARQKSS